MALKEFNRAQAHVPTLSDEFSRSQAEAEALKLGVQEKVRIFTLQTLDHRAESTGMNLSSPTDI